MKIPTFEMYGPNAGEKAIINVGDEDTTNYFIEKGWNREKPKAEEATDTAKEE